MRGLTPPVIEEESKFLGEEVPIPVTEETIIDTITETAPVAIESVPIDPVIDSLAIDVTEIVVEPPQAKFDDPPGGLGVGQFFAIIVFCSIILYILRKFNELKQTGQHIPKTVPSDYMSKLL